MDARATVDTPGAQLHWLKNTSSFELHDHSATSRIPNPDTLSRDTGDRGVRVTFIVAMIIFSIAGVFGNALIIITIACIRTLRNTRNAFLVNLAVSDLVLIIVVVPFNIISVVYGSAYWNTRITLCQVVASVCAPGCLAAIWSNTAVAANRFVFICHNEKYNDIFSPAKTVGWILLVWVIAFSIHLPNHLGWGLNGYVDQFYLCTRETNLWTYSLFFGVVGIVFPLSISFYAYCRIYGLVRKTKSARNQITYNLRRRSLVSRSQPEKSPTLSFSTTPNHLNDDQSSKINLTLVTKTKQARKAFHRELLLVQTLFRTFAVFLLAWLPLAILLMIPMKDVPTWVYLLTVFFAHGSTATNSFMYYWTNDSFHRGFLALLKRRCQQINKPFTSSSFGNPSKPEYFNNGINCVP